MEKHKKMPPNSTSTTMPEKDSVSQLDLIDKCVPVKIPTLVELKRILPKHCFQSSLPKSLYYAFRDLLTVIALYASVLYIDGRILNSGSPLRAILWTLYWYLQGTIMWAIFVVAHDCGHGSFSKYEWVNDIVGNILNTFILVPYYAWKLSHKYHHKNTGNIDKDEIFYPQKVDNPKEGKTHVVPYWGLGFSWFIYLINGYGSGERKAVHFNPWDNLFKGHVMDVSISIILWVAWVALALPLYAKIFGFTALLMHYLVPIFVFASWLVVVTFLHHQDVGVPWYSDEHWDFVKGNLSSVDRHYGWAHSLTHNIGTHQIHHLFIKIPHYHLEEATKVFRENYPHLVRKTDEGIMSSFFKMFKIFMDQHYIEKDVKVHVYKENVTTKKSN
ncbi:sn-1 acyl-lipid omega-3 desaturase (ferredoxin) isoform X1 [Lepeophtheirus salmonis]|uniref:Omega-3 desaturase-like A n=2 Tax=Lepeophtheirus salmonis TaxID=72036 RepID=A0A0K2TVX7_LEPSM|nr:omega-3 fatty acid desaturase, endoplasmic reticulum-like isoform X1 [Lepeophtheirus salmonis]ATV93526.1 omega-3 desaturase-like A [Lepeophtheirus salmonis]